MRSSENVETVPSSRDHLYWLYVLFCFVDATSLSGSVLCCPRLCPRPTLLQQNRHLLPEFAAAVRLVKGCKGPRALANHLAFRRGGGLICLGRYVETTLFLRCSQASNGLAKRFLGLGECGIVAFLMARAVKQFRLALSISLTYILFGIWC